MLDTRKFNKDIGWWSVVNAICLFATWYFAFMPLIRDDYYIGLLFLMFCYSVLRSFALRRLITIPHKHLWVALTALGVLPGLHFGRHPITEQQMAFFDGSLVGRVIWPLDLATIHGVLGLLVGLGTSIPQAFMLYKHNGWSSWWAIINTSGLSFFLFINAALIDLFIPVRSMYIPSQNDLTGASLITIGVSTIYGIFMALFLIRLIHRKPDIDTAVPESG